MAAPRARFGPELPAGAPGEGEGARDAVGGLPAARCGPGMSGAQGHRGTVLSVRLNRSGQYALTCGKDRLVKLWNPYAGRLIKTYDAHGREVRDCCVAADNARFASVGADRQVFLWDVSTGKTIRRFQGHDFPANAVVFAADDQLLVTGSDDR